MKFRLAFATAILIVLPAGLAAQQRVPFVGCLADGQAGPIAPPTGSGGETLLVSPQRIQGKAPLTGPAVVLTRFDGDTSRRFRVAEMLACIFPAHREFTPSTPKDWASKPG